MKTLFLFSTASGYGGAEKSLETVFPALAREFKIVAFVEHDAHRNALERRNELDGGTARIVHLPAGNGPGVWLRNIAAIRREWRRSPPDVLLSNTNKGALWVAVCQRVAVTPIPAFLFVRDFGWQLRPLIFGMLGEWRVIAPSSSIPDSDYWRRWLPAPNVRIIPNAASLPGPTQCTTSDQSDYVLCLANLSRWKGVDFLIRAFSEAAVPGMRLIIQGAVTDQTYRAELGALVSRLGLDDAVEFREFGRDVSTLYANSRFVAVPSISDHGGPESFGRTVIEAWAHAKPVVAFACGGPKSLIRDGVDGFLVPEKNTKVLAEKMRVLFQNESLSRSMGQAGQERALTEFSVATIAAALSITLDCNPQRDVTLSRVGERLE